MQYIANLGAAVSVAVIIIAVAYGMSKVGKAAMDAIARQPEAATRIRSSMILPLAFMEGAALFAIVVCLLIVLQQS